MNPVDAPSIYDVNGKAGKGQPQGDITIAQLTVPTGSAFDVQVNCQVSARCASRCLRLSFSFSLSLSPSLPLSLSLSFCVCVSLR